MHMMNKYCHMVVTRTNYIRAWRSGSYLNDILQKYIAFSIKQVSFYWKYTTLVIMLHLLIAKVMITKSML